jgi:hypothetical protein
MCFASKPMELNHGHLQESRKYATPEKIIGLDHLSSTLGGIYRTHMFTGDSWEEMLSSFEDLISVLYMDWQYCHMCMKFLKPAERTYFESICFKRATKIDLTGSLYKLSRFLAQKFGQRVIVLIDEYEATTNHASEHSYVEILLRVNELSGQFGGKIREL